MTQPTAFTTAMLAWGLLQFPKGFKGGSQTGVLQQIQVRCCSRLQACSLSQAGRFITTSSKALVCSR